MGCHTTLKLKINKKQMVKTKPAVFSHPLLNKVRKRKKAGKICIAIGKQVLKNRFLDAQKSVTI
jgi:hypothetical protein